MPEPVSSIPTDPSKGEKVKGTPDSSEFKKLMKVKKPEEAEFEKGKKRKFTEEEEELSKEMLKSLDPEIKKYMISILNSEFQKEKDYEKMPVKIQKTPEKKKRKKTFKKPSLKTTPLKKEKIVKEKKELPSLYFEIPKDLQITTSKKIGNVKLPSELLPVFEHMVGTILTLQKEKKGVFEIQIILNNPKFEHSRFYGARIILERYSTAPDSFNIILKGPNEAVAIFQENIEGLYKAFKKADVDFSIGNISAEYESYKPLFKRKPAAGFEKEKGKEK
jgi:hypothetical protein